MRQRYVSAIYGLPCAAVSILALGAEQRGWRIPVILSPVFMVIFITAFLALPAAIWLWAAWVFRGFRDSEDEAS